MTESVPDPSSESVPRTPRRYRHVIWDWNGTLLDDVAYSVAIVNGLLARNRLPVMDLARYREIFDFPVRAYYARAGFDLSGEGAFERLGREWMDAYEAQRLTCHLHLGARELLADLHARDLTQSILSAYPRVSLEGIVSHFGLARYFVRLLGLEDIYAHSKLELGRRWLGELGVPRSQVLLVGDTLHDLDVAQALGIDCVLVAHGHQSAPRLRRRSRQVYAGFNDLQTVLLPSLSAQG